MRTLPWPLKYAWVLWGLCWLGLAAGTAANRIASHTYMLPLELTSGSTIQVQVFRFRPDRLRLDMKFQRNPPSQERPELGSIARGDAPGEPVLVRVQANAFSGVFHAGPISGWNGESISRKLFSQDTPDAPSKPGVAPLSAGWSTLQLTILDVGPTLRGERVEVWLHPPLGFKASASGYNFLWPFFFWPILAGLLLVPGIVLGILTWQWHGMPGKRAS